jgi:hypothetical protein
MQCDTCCVITFPTNSIEQRPFWGADSYSSSQEISSFLLNPKVHYHINKSQFLDPMLSQMIPVHILIF